MKQTVRCLLLMLPGFFASGLTAQEYQLLENSTQPLSDLVCTTCHGADGQGSPVVGGPSLAGLEPWYITRQLQSFRAGYRGTQPDYTPGYEMHRSVDELSDAEIETVVTEIAVWPVKPPEPTITGDIDNGAKLYVQCAVCHGMNGEGNAALGAPALTGRNDWYMFQQIKLFQSGYRGSHPEDIYGQQMRVSVSTLESDEQINDVLTYINQL
ncbi:MAG: c-type cytochrome [Pseudohongiellaceae bacterium]